MANNRNNVNTDTKLVKGGDDTALLAFPQILVPDPRLYMRLKLAPQIFNMEGLLMDNRRFHMCLVLAIPAETV